MLRPVPTNPIMKKCMPSEVIELKIRITNNLIAIAMVAICLFMSSSCVRNVDLGSLADEQIVVEGILTENEFPSIRLTKSVSPTNENSFPVAADATVQLSTENFTETLSYQGNGNYTTSAFTVLPDRDYHLEIAYKDQIITSQATLPDKRIEFDSITTERIDSDSLQVRIHFTPLKSGELYLDVLATTETFDFSGSFQFDIELEEQQSFVAFRLPNQPDEVTFTFLEIPAAYRRYLDDLAAVSDEQIIGGLLIGPPAQLEGNIENGLGYFTGIGTSEFVLVIP